MRIEQAKNVSDILRQRLAVDGNRPSYRQFGDGQWQEISWNEFGQLVARWQAAFRKENLQAGDRVAICLKNCIEWVAFDQAAMGLGLVTVPLFYNDRPDNMAWCMNDAGVRLMVIGDGSLWPEIARIPTKIERVVCVEGKCEDAKVVPLKNWLPNTAGDIQYSAAGDDDLLTIVYTSGTTGRPKGVMLTHGNLVTNTLSLTNACPEIVEGDRFLSFLPLSHMLERTVGYYVAMTVGAPVTFARSVLDLAEDMVTQKPTIMVCVPRIFERVYGKVQEGLATSALKPKLFNAAVAMGWRKFRQQRRWYDYLFYPLLDVLVGKKLRGRLGGRIRYILLGGAPMAPHLFETFMGLGLTFLHGYGLTETSPAVCFNRVTDNEPFSVGKPLVGVEVKTTDVGELLVRGHNIMKGYWNNEEATAAAIDSDGWFHTGDVVEIREGRIYITGRVKDIIVMSNGEKVPPGDIEQAILSDAVFEQVMLVGEGRPRLTLVCVSQNNNVDELIERANARLSSFPGYAKIAAVTVVSEPWTVENGLLTPTMKLKRNVMEQRFANEIESMYS
ncbi:MAG: long-chain fatty acid--CoA ligase [Gammaproteobacteria bacterium]|nr:long-chain fatty acid--CoA ligase [Gammaproteobacteria bacterium]